MAFDLKNENILGTGVLPSPSGALATSDNFIDPYSYAMIYKPELMKEVHLQRGKGKLIPFLQMFGSLESFASDQVKHTELGELHQSLRDVSFDEASNTFTSPVKHNLRSNEIVIISDGTIERQAVVDNVTSSTTFVALNKANVDWGLDTSGLTVMKFSNSWGKGEGNFTTGRKDTPNVKTNYPHIIKEYYQTNESDMAHHIWVRTPGYANEEGWFNSELQRTIDSYDNLIELTFLLHQRSDEDSDATLAGYERGMKSITQQIEEGGNIGNEKIETIEELSEIAFRIKQQGGTTNYSWWKDHAQGAAWRKMLAGVNAHYADGGDYGFFNNSKETALELGFKCVYIDGITFHSSELKTLDNPELLGVQQIRNTTIQSMMLPMGDANVLENGDRFTKPFLNIRFRQKGGINRHRKVKFFGGIYGTPHKTDTMEMHIETEMTNQLVGANKFFTFRRGNGIYTGA